MDEAKYSALITKIKRKRKWVIALTIIIELLILLFTSPSTLELNGEVVHEYKGFHPIIIGLLLAVFFFIGLIAYAIVSLPLNTALDNECDPEKQLILNMHLNQQRNIDHIYAVDYLYLGNFTEAMKYAKKAISSSNEAMALSGLFNKARCEFFLGDYDLFCQTANEYESKLSSYKKIKPKSRLAHQKIVTTLNLMRALLEDDIEKINEIRNNIESWNTSKATEGFLNYIRGISAYKAGDKEEAIYRFKYVKENCSKLFFANLSTDYLSLLK